MRSSLGVGEGPGGPQAVEVDQVGEDEAQIAQRGAVVGHAAEATHRTLPPVRATGPWSPGIAAAAASRALYAPSVQDDPERSGGGAGATDRYGMPRWVPRLITIIVLVCVGLFAAYHMLRAVRTLLVLLLISFFLSIALEPGVNFLNRKGWRRGWATGVIFLAFVLVVGLFIGLMVPLVVGPDLPLRRQPAGLRGPGRPSSPPASASTSPASACARP